MTIPVRMAAALGCLGAVLTLGGCTPTLDWREVRPEGSAALALFPCKPATHVRRIALAGGGVELTLHSCDAGDATFALAVADMQDPARVTRALDELADAAQRNVAAVGATISALNVPGMTPNPRARRLQLQGHLPDGRPVQEQVAVFARGTRVYQATVVGPMLDSAAAETFIGALRLPV